MSAAALPAGVEQDVDLVQVTELLPGVPSPLVLLDARHLDELLPGVPSPLVLLDARHLDELLERRPPAIYVLTPPRARLLAAQLLAEADRIETATFTIPVERKQA